MIEFLASYNAFFSFSIIIFVLSLLFDIIFGELPTKLHPVVIIGKIIHFLTKHLIKIKNKISSFILLLSTIILSLLFFIIILYICKINIILYSIVFILILSSTFSFKLLLTSAKDIQYNLINNIDKARQSVSLLVSRDTDELDEGLIISATIETLSENIVDSYISPVFYYFIFLVILNFINFDFYIKTMILIAIPIIYRVINTLDAMVGYKNNKYYLIGYASAIFDDVLNFIPSRLGGLFIVLGSYISKLNWKNSYFILRRDARKCPSPNSGYTMASTAGALDIQLVKKDTYTLGDKNKDIGLDDITNTIKLSKNTMYLFTLIIFIITLLVII